MSWYRNGTLASISTPQDGQRTRLKRPAKIVSFSAGSEVTLAERRTPASNACPSGQVKARRIGLLMGLLLITTIIVATVFRGRQSDVGIILGCGDSLPRRWC